MILLMPPHETPKAIRTLEEARQARRELFATEKAMGARGASVSDLRLEIVKADRLIETLERS